ncbi:MAG: secretin N-terminal domain-containing protein [Chthoniobacterales bacterium]
MSALNRTASGLLSAISMLLLATSIARAQTQPAQPPQPAPPQLPPQAMPDAPAPAPEEEKISVQLPGRPASDVADYYEMLTGKHLIRDNQLNAQQLSIVANNVTKKEAIALIEASLILNGYTIVYVDEKTAKILGPTKPIRAEGGVPLFTDVSLLPPGDEIVSFFMPLRYLKCEEALQVFQQYAPFHPAIGNYTQVPSVNAIVITDTASLVRRLVALKDVIDVQGAKTVTEFFQLERADAEKVTELLSKLFEKNDSNNGIAVNNAPPPNPGQPNPPGGAPPAAGGIVSGIPGKVQVFADKRTNRVVVVAPESQIPYIRSIIENLDVGVEFDEILEKPLRFVRAEEVLPVLAGVLAEGDEKGQANGNNPAPDANQSANANSNDSGFSNNNNSSSGDSEGSSAQLNVGKVETKPMTTSVGNSRIIADRSMNKIIVIGPPEARAKSARVLDMLDQRPKQVYLACIIGQLTLGDNIDFGIDYLMKFGDVRILGQGEAANINNLIANRNASLDVVPGTNTVVNGAVNAAAAATRTALPVVGGLTVFGAIGDSVDILARALASTNRFQVISRPMVYTANGQIAKISSGQDVPFAGSTLSDVNSGSNINNSTTTLNSTTEFKKVRLQLAVRPLINSDKEVTLNISQINDTVASIAQISSGTTAPVISTQSLDTTITVPNRQTIVLGGLISDQEERNVTGIPFLKDIPGVGYLFSSTKKTKTRRELIVLIQPFIIGNEADLTDANYIERANTSFKEGLFDKPVPIQRATLPTPEEIGTLSH